ncbi:MAG TPA: antibiotic biosynthesis monooxygenase family protein [Candidatus Angelobacter sp.]|jgi:quinol monooxygenase YgiN|nr:antibiotic biosynthesis monooxygenase family protein [Candidatus Angelobacter sp.]
MNVTPVSEIREGAPIVTLINVFTVTPENQERLIQVLDDATEAVMRKLPGFISANIHRSLDGTRVTNYAQWESRRAFEAMLADPAARPHMQAAAALASYEPHLYEVTVVHHAGDV